MPHAWMSDIMQQWVGCVQFRTSGVSECNHPYIGLLNMHLQDLVLHANCHIPGKSLSCLTCHIVYSTT